MVQVACEALQEMGLLQPVSPEANNAKVNSHNHMKTSPYQTSSSNHPTQPQLTKVHNLVFHDSTGNHLDLDKLFNSSSTSVKKRAPYIDLATRYVRNFTIAGHVVLVVGVRHLYMSNDAKGTISQFFPREGPRIHQLCESFKSSCKGSSLLNFAGL